MRHDHRAAWRGHRLRYPAGELTHVIYSLASIAKTLGDFMGVKKLPDGAIQRADPHALTIIDYAPILKGSVYDISPPELTEIEINKIRGQQMLAMMDQRRSARANPNK